MEKSMQAQATPEHATGHTRRRRLFSTLLGIRVAGEVNMISCKTMNTIIVLLLFLCEERVSFALNGDVCGVRASPNVQRDWGCSITLMSWIEQQVQRAIRPV